MSQRKQVLTIDGGGTRGFFTYQLIKHILSSDPSFDLIVGVSIGAIIGALVNTKILYELPMERITEYMYEMFSIECSNGPWLSPKYNGRTKTAILQELFGDLLYGDLEIPMAILVDTVYGNTPIVMKSWDPTYKNVPLCKVLDATSAVPILFPSVTINEIQFIDGGTITNSPVAIGYLLGSQIYPTDDIWILSIGVSNKSTGDQELNTKLFSNDEMGIVQLISTGLPLTMLTRGSLLENEIVSELLGDKYYRLEGNIIADIDDTTIQGKCIKLAEKVWKESKTEFKAYMNLELK